MIPVSLLEGTLSESCVRSYKRQARWLSNGGVGMTCSLMLPKRRHYFSLREQVRRARIIVCMIGEKEVEFSQEATRCLGVWLDSGEDTTKRDSQRLGQESGHCVEGRIRYKQY